MHGVSQTAVGKKKHGRSAVSNGSRLFVSSDARSAWSRRYKNLCDSFAQDAGGAENLTELKLSLIRRAASLAVECERIEGQLAEGDAKADVELLARMSSHLRRISESIGLDRKMRDVTPSFKHYVADD